MASHCDISIVIPVLNEAENLAQVLGKIRELGLEQTEIIVVDDGSSDGSADVAFTAGANVVRHPYNIGNGAAVKSGIRAARGRLILLMDGDGQHKAEDIPKLLEETGKYHMIVGARAKGSKLRLHRNAEAMTTVQQKLASLGIAKDAIRTIAIDLQMEYDYVNGRQTPRGYVARNTIEVRVDDFAKLGDVLDAAVGSGATNLHGLRFDVKNREALEREAL
ncbi:MAG TPA: SIMPL domain-containing protein, partial [Candidatus Limnocylindria bacterium]|nr:SIMPL domain-containing protein [Candidatus Limnocylindria bacterium]